MPTNKNQIKYASDKTHTKEDWPLVQKKKKWDFFSMKPDNKSTRNKRQIKFNETLLNETLRIKWNHSEIPEKTIETCHFPGYVTLLLKELHKQAKRKQVA